jgi:hypothetical protein
MSFVFRVLKIPNDYHLDRKKVLKLEDPSIVDGLVLLKFSWL